MDSVKVFVDNVDTFLSRVPAVIAQQISSCKTGHAHTSITVVSLPSADAAVEEI
ncbi:hypothetical protein V1521DRAFT_437791, partial [Lipomyces starkeyi]